MGSRKIIIKITIEIMLFVSITYLFHKEIKQKILGTGIYMVLY